MQKLGGSGSLGGRRAGKVQYMADELSADQIRLLLKLEPNATCGFLRTTYLSAWSTG
jgi:hypothetical protein